MLVFDDKLTGRFFGVRAQPRTATLLLIVTVLLLTSSLSFAEQSGLGLGVAWAPISGHGFSVRVFPDSGIGFQGGWIYWRNSDNSFFNLGASALIMLNHTQSSALYMPLGVRFSHTSEKNYSGWNSNTHTDTDNNLSFGTGLGYALRITEMDGIWYSMDLVLVVKKSSIMPMPQLAVHYFI